MDFKEKVKQVVFDTFYIELNDDDFSKDFYGAGLDDLDVIDLIIRLESDLCIAIPDNEIFTNINTPKQLVDYLEKNVK